MTAPFVFIDKGELDRAQAVRDYFFFEKVLEKDCFFCSKRLPGAVEL
jgi:hypothetical protein